MPEVQALEQLCAAYGIDTWYQDIWGRRHEVPEAGLRALLAAMGVPAATDQELREALAERQAQQWRDLLPPVQVVREQELPARILLTLPEWARHERLVWTLREESGTERSGEFTPNDLPLVEQGVHEAEIKIRVQLALPVYPPLGYHRLRIDRVHPREQPLAADMRLILVPERCYQPPAVADDRRIWGPSLQLYSVRSQRNWGIGDFTDLRAALELSAELGADTVGLNPLHALFLHNPNHASPYSPSSRLYLNLLFLDVEAIAEFADCEEARSRVADPEFQAGLRALRSSELVDYEAVTERKLQLLELLYRYFRDHHLRQDDERGRAFRRYQAEQGKTLRDYALFEALQAHFHAQDPAIWGWPAWPEAYRRRDAQAVAAFAEAQLEQVEFYEYLQWQAEEQLAAAGRRSMELGLGVGLYADLAVSIDSGGAEAWANQDLYALSARVGAPPDEFNMKGQDWGLPPLIPDRLRQAAYNPFIATLRRNMRHAGALRIDHVMGLMRLYWVPPGRPATEGAYVSYPLQDLLGILALESQRNQCLVIGEDLGTVPDAVREALEPLGVLSYRLFYFEKNSQGGFKAPNEHPRQALVAVSTHDLPTLRGYWEGVDLERRAALDLFPSDDVRDEQILYRTEDRVRLLQALSHQGLLPAGTSVDPLAMPKMTDALAVAVHAYLARSQAQMMMVQPEDLFNQPEQVNLPGTTDQHPNWRRKLRLRLEEWRDAPRVQAIAHVLSLGRGIEPRQALPRRLGPPPCAGQIPLATYRLQFNRDFTFAQAAELVPYLQSLGISHCYASPYLKARPGSTHGYDIIDHNQLNPEIGSEQDFERFVAALRQHGMGQVLDIVPNHMGIMGADNLWWQDVLENGPASIYAHYFDIDWHPLKEELRGRVLVPVLGDHYGSVLEQGDLKLRFEREAGTFSLNYYEHRFPLDPAQYPRILGHQVERLQARLGDGHPDVLEYLSLADAFRHLPARTEQAEARLAERNRNKEIHKAQLARLCQRSPDIAWFIEENVQAFNGNPGDPGSFSQLHELISAQAYRLAYWRVASDEINYRRFFDIADLAALRMENPDVFQATHQLVFKLIDEGKVHGLRIDHPDGLYDPQQYFERLQAHFRVPTVGDALTDEGSTQQLAKPIYLLAEKILAGHEHLPSDWPIHGTTGYEFANLVNGVLLEHDAEGRLERVYYGFVLERMEYEEIVYRSKKLIMKVSLTSELSVLAEKISHIAQADLRTRDFTLNGLRTALSEVVACLPVYRTYINERGCSSDDRRHLEWAIAVAKRRSRAADISIFDFVRDVLLTDIAQGKGETYRQAVLACAMKFQQYSGPVMAKGLEDTTFYIYNRLASLNEVGNEPRRFGTSVAGFHRANQERLKHWPHSMLATSTHDSKRSEDVRARITVLSELVDEWRRHLQRWARLNRHKKHEVEGQQAPSRNDEYLLYQTLVGAWPLEELDEQGLAELRDRIDAYMLKAIREAKIHTSWINQNDEYEAAMSKFVAALFERGLEGPFLAELAPFARRLARYGLFNSLSQTLLKLTSPGVPDCYQGNEVWDFSLVDPDNRRPVDYARRARLLAEVQALAPTDAGSGSQVRKLLDSLDDGRAKLYLTWRLLQLRQSRPALFQQGDYVPLETVGSRANHLCAFLRGNPSEGLIVVAPRLFVGLIGQSGGLPLGEEVWADTWIQLPDFGPGQLLRDELTGTRLKVRDQDGVACLAVAEVLRDFTGALLTISA